MQSCVVCCMCIGKMKRDSRIGGYVAKWHMRSFCCVSWCCLCIKCILFIRSYRLDCLVHVQDEHLWVNMNCQVFSQILQNSVMFFLTQKTRYTGIQLWFSVLLCASFEDFKYARLVISGSYGMLWAILQQKPTPIIAHLICKI